MNRNAFTLIELIVVIAIIAILVALLLPALLPLVSNSTTVVTGTVVRKYEFGQEYRVDVKKSDGEAEVFKVGAAHQLPSQKAKIQSNIEAGKTYSFQIQKSWNYDLNAISEATPTEVKAEVEFP